MPGRRGWKASALWVLLALLGSSGADEGATGRRVALVIGNGAYKNMTRLTNPANDRVFSYAGIWSVLVDDLHVEIDGLLWMGQPGTDQPGN